MVAPVHPVSRLPVLREPELLREIRKWNRLAGVARLPVYAGIPTRAGVISPGFCVSKFLDRIHPISAATSSSAERMNASTSPRRYRTVRRV